MGAGNRNKNGFDGWNILGFIGTLGIIQMILFCVLFIASLFAWLYIFSLDGKVSTKIMILEGVIFLIILIVTLMKLFVVGYERSVWKFFWSSYFFATVVSILGYYISSFPLLSYPASERGVYMYYILQFLGYVLMAAALSLIPILIIAAIRSFIITVCDMIL